MTSNRLLSINQYFADRADGRLSLSGGRLGSLRRARGQRRSSSQRGREGPYEKYSPVAALLSTTASHR